MAKRGPGNPYHDPKTGEFTSGSGSGSASGHNAGGGNRKIVDHVKLEHRLSDNEFLTELAKKHDPKGYAKMMNSKILKHRMHQGNDFFAELATKILLPKHRGLK